ncbi:MAG: hypothetical protein LBD48_09635 [Treponema sp.]|jgi:hypothetical protein|nr:hypothetical protein [Treponema sp.]
MRNCSFFALVAVAACLSVFSACQQSPAEENYDPIDSRLEGSWTNSQADRELKTFDINRDGTFSASVDPNAANMERGTVTGKLVRKGTDYLMINMKSEAPVWGTMVGSMTKGQYCQLEFANETANDAFTFGSADSEIIDGFFGGNYSRQAAQP